MGRGVIEHFRRHKGRDVGLFCHNLHEVLSDCGVYGEEPRTRAFYRYLDALRSFRVNGSDFGAGTM